MTTLCLAGGGTGGRDGSVRDSAVSLGSKGLCFCFPTGGTGEAADALFCTGGGGGDAAAVPEVKLCEAVAAGTGAVMIFLIL